MGALPHQHKDCKPGEAEVCRAALGLPGSCWHCRECELWGSITLLGAWLRYGAACCNERKQILSLHRSDLELQLAE